MSENSILTVILSTYNHKDSFRKAIESVLSQKTSYKYEIWILDDASNDGTTEIVKEYANKYPAIITPYINKYNERGKHLINYLKKLKTKYYTVLETDDYWCDDNKIQRQVDILENNPDCSMCAHNTIRNYVSAGKKEEYIRSHEGIYKLPETKLTHRYYIEPHTSSRMYRTSCIDWQEVGDSQIVVYDVCATFYFLTKGNMYYIDKVMSVYNYTGNGVYSSSSSYQNRYNAANGIYKINKQLNFKYNYLLARFFSTRLNLNFILSNKLKKCSNPAKLDTMYTKVLSDFEKQNMSFVDKKPILSYKIPVGSKKRLCIEICREKDLC